ncbi:MAG: hypothetical protein KJ559_01310 [Nanoarchaeota archaeon]|nr:hypothetical protein [Nanoarchaeota archaeon]
MLSKYKRDCTGLKGYFFCFLLTLFFVLIIPLTLAELKIEKQALIDVVIPEINQPAVFNLKITNLGENDLFRAYSLVGVDIEPEDYFEIRKDEVKDVAIYIKPNQKILETPGTFNFIYKIEGKNSGIQEDALTIKITEFKDALDMGVYNINFDSETAVVYVRNKVGASFYNINAEFYSAFFDFEKSFDIQGNEKKEFEIELDKESLKKLVAGQYTITTKIKINSLEQDFKNIFKFTEKANIVIKENKQGFFIYKDTIEKINEGNLPFVVQAKMSKNIIARLFTTFNIEPLSSNRRGFVVDYTFQKEIMPSESLVVRATTNWFYPLILLTFILIIFILISTYAFSDLLIKKKVSYVKTKGGEFALKVTLHLKAKKFIENLKIVDKIPPVVKVYKKFGLIHPDRIDEKNKRLEWNMESLQEGEERILSYVIYSKFGIIGKFELPTTTVIYERENKVHEIKSNKAFFLTEPKKINKEKI